MRFFGGMSGFGLSIMSLAHVAALPGAWRDISWASGEMSQLRLVGSLGGGGMGKFVVLLLGVPAREFETRIGKGLRLLTCRHRWFGRVGGFSTDGEGTYREGDKLVVGNL